MRSIVFQFRVVARMPRADSMMRPGWPGRPPMSRVIESTCPRGRGEQHRVAALGLRRDRDSQRDVGAKERHAPLVDVVGHHGRKGFGPDGNRQRVDRADEDVLSTTDDGGDRFLQLGDDRVHTIRGRREGEVAGRQVAPWGVTPCMLHGTSQDVGRKTCPADHDVAYEASEPTRSHL